MSGVLDFMTVPRLAKEGDVLLKGAQSRGLEQVEVDLSGIESANSAGLALLLEWMDMARTRGLRLTYLHLPESLGRIAAVSNLHRLLPIGA
nr:STAS domain-containing protein [Thiocystis violacea]